MAGFNINNFDELLEQASRLPPAHIGVVLPSHPEVFAALAEAQRALRCEFHLVGDRQIIEAGLAHHVVSPGSIQIHHCRDAEAALRSSVDLARTGVVDILMKGNIDTSKMMKAVLSEGSGLRTGKLLSDIFIFEFPPRQGNKFIMITDGGITLAPDLREKVQLIENAVEVAQILGNRCPKVAILSATELVLHNLQSTVDAAELTAMNRRGEIKNCIVVGPLALDNALSVEAAAVKGIDSPVAGHAEILVAPNIETANNLAKATTYFGNYRLAHVVVGSRLPILIPSRADKRDARVLSIALGIVVSSSSKSPSRDSSVLS